MGAVQTQKQVDNSIRDFPMKNKKITRQRMIHGFDQFQDYIVLWDNIINIGRFKDRKSRKKQFTYDQLLTKPSKSIEMIQKDIQRTFPNQKFSKNQENRKELERVLTALSNRFPQIGYVSGMNFYVMRVLQVANQQDAFWIVTWFYLRDRLIYNSLTSQKSMQVLFDIVSEIMQTQTPNLTSVMKHIGISFQVFALTWIKSWFSIISDADTFYIIISLAMLEGPWAWIVCIVSMLKCLQPKILRCNRSYQKILEIANGKGLFSNPQTKTQFKQYLLKGLQQDGKKYLDRIQNLIHLDQEVEISNFGC